MEEIPYSGSNRNDLLLFSESQSRFVVTVDPSKKKAFEELLSDTIYGEIGVVLEDEIFRIIGFDRKRLSRLTFMTLKRPGKNLSEFK